MSSPPLPIYVNPDGTPIQMPTMTPPTGQYVSEDDPFTSIHSGTHSDDEETIIGPTSTNIELWNVDIDSIDITVNNVEPVILQNDISEEVYELLVDNRSITSNDIISILNKYNTTIYSSVSLVFHNMGEDGSSITYTYGPFFSITPDLSLPIDDDEEEKEEDEDDIQDSKESEEIALNHELILLCEKHIKNKQQNIIDDVKYANEQITELQEQIDTADAGVIYDPITSTEYTVSDIMEKIEYYKEQASQNTTWTPVETESEIRKCHDNINKYLDDSGNDYERAKSNAMSNRDTIAIKILNILKQNSKPPVVVTEVKNTSYDTVSPLIGEVRTCKDAIQELDNEYNDLPIFLKKNNDNIVLILKEHEDKYTYYCSTRSRILKGGLGSSLFYTCRYNSNSNQQINGTVDTNLGTFDEARHSLPYYKFEYALGAGFGKSGMTGLVSLENLIRTIVMSKEQLFEISETGRFFHGIYSYKAYHRLTNIISAEHCAAGDIARLYKISNLKEPSISDNEWMQSQFMRQQKSEHRILYYKSSMLSDSSHLLNEYLHNCTRDYIRYIYSILKHDDIDELTECYHCKLASWELPVHEFTTEMVGEHMSQDEITIPYPLKGHTGKCPVCKNNIDFYGNATSEISEEVLEAAVDDDKSRVVELYNSGEIIDTTPYIRQEIQPVVAEQFITDLNERVDELRMDPESHVIDDYQCEFNGIFKMDQMRTAQINKNIKKYLYLIDVANHIINGMQYNGKSIDIVHTPLLLAAENGHCKMVKKIVQMGAKANSIACLPLLDDDNLYTPLSLATINGHKDIVKFLSYIGADINTQDSNGNTPFTNIILVQNPLLRYFDTMQLLMELKVDITIPNFWSNTAIHYIHNTQVSIFDELVKFNYPLKELNIPNNLGVTPLHFAVYKLQHKVVDKLIKLLTGKDNPYYYTNAGESPLDIAIKGLDSIEAQYQSRLRHMIEALTVYDIYIKSTERYTDKRSDTDDGESTEGYTDDEGSTEGYTDDDASTESDDKGSIEDDDASTESDENLI